MSVRSDDAIGGLFEVPEENSFHKILTDLIAEDNVAMKTEIHNPLALAQLKTVSITLLNEKMKLCSAAIETFIQWFLTYMVSKDRQSRQEIRDILTEGIKAERSMGDKLTKPPGD